MTSLVHSEGAARLDADREGRNRESSYESARTDVQLFRSFQSSRGPEMFISGRWCECEFL
ncbi:MAG: hypothetical protein DWI22_01305 [Planctomycetota bacterium]|nr:MAG: hypothetical protein DWI22_01305 [Planctomycetota bacterium]